MGNDALSSGDYQSVQHNGNASTIPLDSCCDYDFELCHDNGLVRLSWVDYCGNVLYPSNQSFSSMLQAILYCQRHCCSQGASRRKEHSRICQ
jgi:hypothetical protein